MVSGDFGGQVSRITDRCQIKKQSLRVNDLQDVAWSSGAAKAE